jgi:hypothetical protein
MSFWRTITAHVLAASLLVAGVCPGSVPNLVGAGRGPDRSLSQNGAVASQNSGARAATPSAKPCCRRCDGKCCGMRCCCQSPDSQRHLPPTAPARDSQRDFGRWASASVDLPAEFSADAVARWAALGVAALSPPVASTLQSQSVRIQT